MFYNYLIFNMVTLSLRILLKYCVSRCETLRFTTGNTLFLGEKRSVSNRVETNYEIVLLILLNYVIRKQQSN